MSLAGHQVPWELSSNALISIRAEEAWRITRGSPGVTIAIIDESFDTSWLAPGALIDTVSACNEHRSLSSVHGTLLAGLISGTRVGYPGVAPSCRLLGIELPSYCSDYEEAKAFDLALSANAAVVCCGWGPRFQGVNIERPVPPNVAFSIARLARTSRNGLGAIVFFAVGSTSSNVQFDGYVSHPAVTAVSGITFEGQVPASMDFGDRIEFFAPVSGANRSIGGTPGVPEGASGATALATGVAALVFSANPEMSALQVLSILRSTAGALSDERSTLIQPQVTANAPLSFSSVINAAGAVKESLDIYSFAAPGGTAENETDLQPPFTVRLRQRERRFIGGEHTILGRQAIDALTYQYVRFSPSAGSTAGPDAAFFTDIFTDFTPSPSLTAQPAFADSIKKIFDQLFIDQSLTIPSRGRFKFMYLVGLAGDLYGFPTHLSADLQNRRPIDDLTGVFDKEIVNPHNQSDSDLFVYGAAVSWVFFGGSSAHYLGLAAKNFSHFAGDNLLAYLSYHLLAVDVATQCAAVADKLRTEESDAERLSQLFTLSLIYEAFAAHYLTDIFSAGHARVPRRAILDAYPRGVIPELRVSQQISKFLHEYEGKLGVFFTNSLGYIWYGFGDGALLSPAMSNIYSLANGTLSPLPNSAEPLNVRQLLTPGDWDGVKSSPSRPRFLASTLVFASLADVIRHMAANFPIEASAQGQGNRGLLGYVLDRLPYALPTRPFPPSLEGALVPTFDKALVSGASLTKRLEDIQKVYGVIHSPEHMKPITYTKPLETFERDFYPLYLSPESVRLIVSDQVSYLSTVLDSQSATFLGVIPKVISQYCALPNIPVISPCEVKEDIHLDDSWKHAAPSVLLKAYLDKELDPADAKFHFSMWGV